MRPSLAFLFAFASLPILGAPVACSSGGNESPRDTFVAQFCQTFEPCCEAAKVPDGAQSCKSWSYWQGPTYDAAAGSACLSAMQQARSGGALCAALPEVCAHVFGLPYGSVPAGGTCSLDTDCDPGDGGVPPVCFITSQTADRGTGTCVQMSKGKAGDSPCFVQLGGAVTSASWPPAPPPHALVCDVSDGVYCDFGSNVCEPVKSAGETCDAAANVPECGFDATCSKTSQPVCTPRLGAGAGCDPAHPTCGADLYCDTATSTCTAMVPIGGACTTGDQCPGQCSKGICVSYAPGWICGSG